MLESIRIEDLGRVAEVRLLCRCATDADVPLGADMLGPGPHVQNNVNTSQSVSCKDFYGCSCAWASGGSPIESRACACVNTQPRDMSLDHALMEVSGNQHAKGISKAYRQSCVFG